MKRETFIALISALMAEADDELIREVEGQVFFRKRELKAAAIQRFQVGWIVKWTTKDGQRKEGIIHHLNKYSVTVHHPHPTQGYIPEVIPLERIIMQTAERSTATQTAAPSTTQPSSVTQTIPEQTEFTLPRLDIK